MEIYVCEKCKNEIQNMTESVACPKCGKYYHRECWEAVPNCKICMGFNNDYAKAKLSKAMEADNINKLTDSKSKTLASDKAEKPTRLKSYDLYNNSTFHYNIGGKLKSGATAITVIGIIIGILVALTLTIIDGELFLWGILIGSIIGVIGWLSSIILYAYGELVSSAEKTANILIKIYEEIKEDE